MEHFILFFLEGIFLSFIYPFFMKFFLLLFGADLPYFTGETALQKKFSNFGKIAEVQMVKDVITERSKGLAFIQYTCQDDAMLALETMDQQSFYGRTISVELAKLDSRNFVGPPKASGPPKKWNLPAEQVEEVDCWY